MSYVLNLPITYANRTLWGRVSHEDALVERAQSELRRYRLNKTIERFNTEYFKNLLTRPSVKTKLKP
jgi:hypothetical protein